MDSDIEDAAFDVDVAYLALQGFPSSRIAKELNVDHQKVIKVLDRLTSEWRRMANIAIEQYAGQALAIALVNIQKATESFELSKKPARRTRVIAEKVTSKGESRMVPQRQEITEEENAPGDPRWLMVIDASIRTIIKIVGIEKAAQLTAQFTTNVTQINAQGNVDELADRARRFAAQFGLTVEQYAESVSLGLRDGKSVDSQDDDPHGETSLLFGGR
jgi:hypothetical protein